MGMLEPLPALKIIFKEKQMKITVEIELNEELSAWLEKHVEEACLDQDKWLKKKLLESLRKSYEMSKRYSKGPQ
jgi:hemerythrin